MLYTIPETIQIAEISQYLAVVAIDKGGLFGSGIDINLPRKIYMAKTSLEYWYDLDPADENLNKVANYTYALCGKFGLQALAEIGSGGAVSPVSPSTVPDPYDFEVSASSFIANGESSKTIPEFAGFNLLFIRNSIAQSQVNLGGSYFIWSRDTAELTISPAVATGELIQLYPFL